MIPLPKTGNALCPVQAVETHLAETSGGPKDGIFRIPGKGKQKFISLTHPALVKGIKQLVSAAGLDPTQFAGHSLRRGGATLAFKLRAPVHQIQMQGIWRSMAVLGYNEASATDRLVLPTRMAAAARRGHTRRKIGVRSG